MKKSKERKVERHYDLRNLAHEVWSTAPRKWAPDLLQKLRDELNRIMEQKDGQV